METFETAAAAADFSVSHTVRAFCTNTEANRNWLMTHCDGSADSSASDDLEWWGVDDNDNSWRVHIRAPL